MVSKNLQARRVKKLPRVGDGDALVNSDRYFLEGEAESAIWLAGEEETGEEGEDQSCPSKKTVWSLKRCNDDQCAPPPTVFTLQCDTNGVILHFDSDGLLRDQLNRIGYIADNFQFQFDLPVQSGGYGEKDFGKYKDPKTGDVFLTWRGSSDFYKCQSGNFDNLYSQSIGGQCMPTRIMIFHCVQ